MEDKVHIELPLPDFTISRCLKYTEDSVKPSFDFAVYSVLNKGAEYEREK